jgi:hypothetical protein
MMLQFMVVPSVVERNREGVSEEEVAAERRKE